MTTNPLYLSQRAAEVYSQPNINEAEGHDVVLNRGLIYIGKIQGKVMAWPCP